MVHFYQHDLNSSLNQIFVRVCVSTVCWVLVTIIIPDRDHGPNIHWDSKIYQSQSTGPGPLPKTHFHIITTRGWWWPTISDNLLKNYNTDANTKELISFWTFNKTQKAKDHKTTPSRVRQDKGESVLNQFFKWEK